MKYKAYPPIAENDTQQISPTNEAAQLIQIMVFGRNAKMLPVQSQRRGYSPKADATGSTLYDFIKYASLVDFHQ
jgi:hypothetical protein